jgi:hypothetical protein
MPTLPRFEAEIRNMHPNELRALKRHYTKKIGGSSMASAGSIFLGPFMLVGLGLAAATAGNATLKINLINDELKRQGEDPGRMRKRDIGSGQVKGAAFDEAGHMAKHLSGSEAVGFCFEQGLDRGLETPSRATAEGWICKDCGTVSNLNTYGRTPP